MDRPYWRPPPAAARAALAWLPALLGFLLGLAAVAPPAPVAADAPAERFSAERAHAVLQRLLGDGSPHPVGSTANAAVRERLIAELTGLGLEVETQEAFACNLRFDTCGDVVNVLARLPGPDTGVFAVLSAHYDSVGAGPGAADDMAGVAALIEVARASLAGEALQNPVLLLFTDGEEAGLLGARAFLRHPLAQRVGVVANVEARGTRGASLMFETSPDNGWLVREMATHGRRLVTNSLLYEAYRLLPNDTDLTEFRSAGMSGVNFAFIGELSHYHTPLDEPGRLSLRSLQHHGENLMAAVRAFGTADLTRPPRGGAVYTSLAPGAVLRLPSSAALPAAVLGLSLVLAAAYFAVRRTRVSVLGVVLGVVVALLTVALSAVISTGAAALLQLVRPSEAPWYAHPLPLRTVGWAVPLAGAALLAAVVAPRSGRWGLTLGAWMTWAALGVTAALLLPGASILLFVPTLVAGILHLAAALLGRGRRHWSAVAVALSSGVAAYLWLPLASTVESGLGLGLVGAVSAMVALFAITVTGLLVPPEERAARPTDVPVLPGQRRRRERRSRRSAGRPRGAAVLAGNVAAAAALFGLLAAAVVPAYSADRPRRLSLAHLQEWQDGRLVASRWLANASPGGPLPAGLAAAADWRDPVPFLPFTTVRTSHAPAPDSGHAPPTLDVVATETTGDETSVTLRIVPSAAPLRVVVGLPADLGLAGVRFVGSSVEWDYGREAGIRDRHVSCQGETCAEMNVQIAVRSGAPYELYVAELLPGLPDGGEGLASARGDAAVPSQDGDLTIQLHRLTLELPAEE